MFGFIPAWKVNDSLTINALDTRKDDKQVNVDIAHVVTTEDDGEELTTYFGIQGRSDHLAKAIANCRERSAKTSLVEATMTKDDLAALRADVKQQIDTATANNVVVA